MNSSPYLGKDLGKVITYNSNENQSIRCTFRQSGNAVILFVFKPHLGVHTMRLSGENKDDMWTLNYLCRQDHIVKHNGKHLIVCPRVNARMVATIHAFGRHHPRIRRPSNRKNAL